MSRVRGCLRIGILGFDLESNAWAPTVGRAQFEENLYLAGQEIAADLASPNPRCPAEISGFVNRMSERCEWEPIYLFVTGCGGAGAIEQEFLHELVLRTCNKLAEAGDLDAVYVAAHGAAVGTRDPEPDSTLFEAVRAQVGPSVRVVATLDLHALLSARMIAATDLLCAYRTNPHVDQYERGAEAADALMEMLAGARTARAFIRVPLLPPQTALSTSTGAFAETVALGSTLMDSRILNISICGNFSYADSPRNGIGIVVSTRGDRQAATETACLLASRIWADRHQYVPRLVSLAEVMRRIEETVENRALPALAVADVADNPGGGAPGNSIYLLEAIHKADVQDAALGVFTDAPLAAEAHARGVGASFMAQFNRSPTSEYSLPFRASATVAALSSGIMVGRRGTARGRTLNMGPSACLKVGGTQVVVIGIRQQLLDPVQLEHFGIDVARLRCLIAKSRGHFRAGFDEFFDDSQILEVDVPGMVTPVLTRLPFRNLTRPIFPMDPEMMWDPRPSVQLFD